MTGGRASFAATGIGLRAGLAQLVEPALRNGRVLSGALWRDEHGSYSLITALLLPILVGFVGFGTEVGLWMFEHQKMQAAADAAAYSAALAYSLGNTSGFQAEARGVARRHGFKHGAASTTVAVNQPPSSGIHASTSGAVEVIVQEPEQRLFTALLTSSALAISARAVAAPINPTTVCVLGLDPTAASTVDLSNNAKLPNPNCGVASNSSSASGLSLSNNASIDAPTTSHGGVSVSNNAHLNGNPNLTNAAPVPDPYASVDPGTPPPCTTQNAVKPVPGNATFSPGHFCSGINFSNNFTATFQPGVYFIDGQFKVSNNSTVNGDGVTFVINGNYAIGDPSSGGISNNAILNLKAPTTGPTAGIVFFGLRSATSTVTQRFSNNTVLNLTGAIYFPNQILDFDNNASSAGANGCTQVIARRVLLSNNVSLGSNCAGIGVTPVGFGGSVALVE